MAQTEFEKLSSEVRKKLGRGVGEKVLTLSFRLDIYRQHLERKGRQHARLYRAYDQEDLQPLINQGILANNWDYKLNSVGQGLKVDYPLLVRPQLRNQQEKMFFRNANGEVQLHPFSPIEVLTLKFGCTGTNGF